MRLASFCTSAAATVLAIRFLITGAGAAGRSDQRQSRPLAPSPRPDESVLLSVPASSPWTDTGVDLRSGDQVVIRAWGSVRYVEGRGGAPGSTGTGPNGAGPGGGCSFVVADSGVPADALVANIAPQLTLNGAGVFVGTSRTVTLPVMGTSAPSGRLFLGVNHGGVLCDRSGFDSWEFRNGSSGAFTVQFTIRRRR